MEEHQKFLFDLQGFLVVEDAISPPQVSHITRSAKLEGSLSALSFLRLHAVVLGRAT